jgi:glycosyltransferase involved in cell wall biosynthesis
MPHNAHHEGADQPMATVIVPCRNEAAHLPAFLDSLRRQDGIAALEIIVADGASDDGSRALLERAHVPGLRVIDNPAGLVATGLNLAIRAARGPVVLRMDVHTEYAPDYVRECLRTLARTGADNVGGPARTRASGYLARAIALAYQSPLACGGARFHDPGYEGPVDTVTYGCWPRALFDRVGLFDERLVRNQDDEHNLRITRSGGSIWQSPRIVSWYRPRASLGALFRQYFQYGFWKVAVIRKHRAPAAWRHLVPGAFVLTLLLLAAVVAVAWAIGGSGAAFVPLAALMLVVAAYLGALGGESLRIAAATSMKYLPILPVVIATYHVSYGLGFLVAMARLGTGRFDGTAPRAATALTR